MSFLYVLLFKWHILAKRYHPCIVYILINFKRKTGTNFSLRFKDIVCFFFFVAFSFYWFYTSTYFCCLFSWWGCWCSSNTLSVLNLEFVQQILRAYYCKFDYLLPFQKCKTWINVRACVHRRDVKKKIVLKIYANV